VLPRPVVQAFEFPDRLGKDFRLWTPGPPGGMMHSGTGGFLSHPGKSMRQIGILPSQRDAERFAAWLATQNIDAQTEPDGAGWAIWVRDEDLVPQARQALAEFQANPAAEKFQTARRRPTENAAAPPRPAPSVIVMRDRWQQHPGEVRRSPMVLLMILTTVLVAILTYDDTFGEGRRGRPGAALRTLLFCDPLQPIAPNGTFDVWANVRKGEVWRLVTPIFIHFGWVHLILNMLWLHSFGGPVEDRRGSLFFLAMVLVVAVVSNAAQAVETAWRGSALFGGMSGVDYGLLGYVVVKSRTDPRERYFVAPGTTFIALLWLVLCILREIPPFSDVLARSIPPIANSAHVAGLIAGAALAWLPLPLRRT
jgi:GlpG protein